MDELDRGSQVVLLGSAITKRAGDQQQDRWPQTFAARADDVVGDRADQSDIRAKAAADHGIDRGHVLGNHRMQVSGGEYCGRQGVGVGHDGLRTSKRLEGGIIWARCFRPRFVRPHGFETCGSPRARGGSAS